MKLNTLSARIGLGFALIALIFAVSVGASYWQAQNVKASARLLQSVRIPTALAGLRLVAGVNRSQSALRNWIILADPESREVRKQAWNREINPALSTLSDLADEWTNAENRQRMDRVETILKRLETEQETIETLARVDPERTRIFLKENAAPLAAEIRELLDRIVAYQSEKMEENLVENAANLDDLVSLVVVLLGIGITASSTLAWAITRSVVRPVNQAIAVADEISRGRFEVEVRVSGTLELEALGQALERMRAALLAGIQESERRAWLSQGGNAFSASVQGDRTVAELAASAIAFLAGYVTAEIGALYLLDDDGRTLRLAGSYAFGTEGESREIFLIEEGVIGQVAKDQKSRALAGGTATSLRILSGLSDTPPTHLLLLPFLFEGRTLGVVELGGRGAFSETQVDFLEQNLDRLAVVLNTAIARQNIRELLEETQTQAEELEVGQEELRQSNEELEEQTRRLKEQQEELEVTNEELEEQTRRVEEQNRELETARSAIERKAKELEITGKYKSEFLANMSHELRTPLNSLLILARDLANNKEKNLSPDQVESAEIITRSGIDLLNLINEILDLARIESGRMDLVIAAVDLQNFADAMRLNFSRVARDKGLTFAVTVAEDLPATMETDLQRLDQVLKNLISNAIKFTETGGVTVEIARVADGRITFAVRDTGIGIPEDKHQIIFEAFQQADGGTSRRFGGTGLGLSISRELARLLGGEIQLQSEVGRGSVFSLLLPPRASASVPVAKEQRRKREKTEPAREGPYDPDFVNYPAPPDDRDRLDPNRHTILIVEDDANFARVLQNQTHEKGFQVLIAATGEDGLLLSARFLPDAIILDLDLPGINGQAVLAELKSNPALRHIPVHIISADDKSLDLIRSGAVEFLTKPVTREGLEGAFGRIENFVNRRVKNLLICEDDETMRRSIKTLIGNGDVRCLEAPTGAMALEIIGREPVDCLVLDIGLPDMSGFELIDRLERNGTPPPIIVYTGRELTRQEAQGLEERAGTIIVKGVRSEERLLDETALFLHRTVRNLPPHKRIIIDELYNPGSVLKDRTILLVDDDMRNVFALSRVLKDMGLQIVKAENGRRALEELDRARIDLVLMDIMMPEMDGYEAMREIRKRPQWKGLPIIALTAKAMKDDRRKCIEAGADDYIAKPVVVERLISLLRVWMRK